MIRGRTAQVLTQHWDGAALRRRPDHLIVEEPLEVHLDGHLVGTTMRTRATTSSWPWASCTATGSSPERRC